MPTELATIVALRQPSSEARDVSLLARVHRDGARQLSNQALEVDLIAFATPGVALDAIEDLLVDVAHVAVGMHVAELSGEQLLDPDAEEIVTTLAQRARLSEVLVTDVVAQLDSGSERVYSGRGHLSIAGRPVRLHVLSNQVSGRGAPTFGRDVELASLDWMVDELLRGSGRAVIFEGEAGIGKTHLTGQAAERAESAGLRVARSAADELGHDRPGHVAVGLLADISSDQGPDLGDRSTLGGGDHRFVDDFISRVETVAQERPVLLIAEDLHWADDLSLRAIAALGVRLAPISAALVVSFRPTPRPASLSNLVRVLEGGGAEHHQLDPIDPEAVTALVAALTGAPPGPRLRDRLLATAGNPLFVIEMLGALEQSDALDIDSGVVEVAADATELPGKLRDTVLSRLRDLPEPTLSLLRHACLLGSACELEALSVVAGVTSTVVTERLLPAVEAGVLARIGDDVEFRHDVIRETMISDLPQAVRREMHTAAGTALAAAGAAPVQVARQLALGANPGDTTAVEWLERAAHHVRTLDPSATVDLLEEALTMAPRGWPGARRIECALIEPLTAAGRVDEAIELGRSMLHSELDPSQREQATSGLVSALATRGDLRGASEVAARAADDPDTDPQRRPVFECIATSLRIFVDGATDEARLAARTALESPLGSQEPALDGELACWAHHSLGIAALVEGDYEAAFASFHESSLLLQGLDINDHGFLIPHANAATAAAYLDDFGRFEKRWRAVMQDSRSRGEATLLVIGHFGEAITAWLTCRWDDASTEAEAGLSLAADTGADSMTVGLRAIAALVETGRGRAQEADHHLACGLETLASGAHLYGVDLLVLAQARRLEETGDVDAAASVLADFWRQAGSIALALQHRDLLPHVLRLAGDVLGDRCSEVLDTADRAASLTPIASTRAVAIRCRGLVKGDPDLFIESAQLLRQGFRRIELAETCEDAATACFEAGRRDEGGTLVDEAVAIWAEAGATNHIARLDALARANGIRRRRSAPSAATHGWDSLSPKEIEVVGLVADGLSNPEVGERLYISRRTVESHLSHVFTKLGLSNRAQLAAAVAERRAGENQ